MATLSTTQIITEIRTRVGDDNAASYLMSDTAFTSAITRVGRLLAKYVKNEVEDTSLSGNAGNVYVLPSGVARSAIQNIKLRWSDNPATDTPITSYDSHHGSLIFPLSISSGAKIVIWYFKPYTIGTDDIPEHVQEFLYKLLEKEWYDYAIKKRADFEQWAALGRSVTSISELRALKGDVTAELQDMANSFGSTLTVGNLGGGA